ncbi:MAG: putative NADH-flavin reductase [Bradyrhizobium sp.]|nr:putative NADH-flavin reductase [Bradyrhizobium sp.]
MTAVATLGGSGRLGQRVVRGLLERNCSIRALSHRGPVDGADPRVTVVHGDVHDPAAMASLLNGVELVVSTLGNASALVPDICSTAIRHLMPVMQARSIHRIVSTTGSAARLDQEAGANIPGSRRAAPC